jgi:hypothetical protein
VNNEGGDQLSINVRLRNLIKRRPKPDMGWRRRRMKEEGLGRKLSWSNRGTLLGFAWMY